MRSPIRMLPGFQTGEESWSHDAWNISSMVFRLPVVRWPVHAEAKPSACEVFLLVLSKPHAMVGTTSQDNPTSFRETRFDRRPYNIYGF